MERISGGRNAIRLLGGCTASNVNKACHDIIAAAAATKLHKSSF
jgi:hypothetical protein